jgi:hypothetical protein
MSKGSKPRPFTDKDIFDEHFDRIFRTEQKAFKDLEKSISKHSKDYAKLAEYELNPSTGEVEKLFKDEC